MLKRGFTIDTWDFQAEEDADIAGGDIMVIDKDKSRFGVMFGDNTGMMAGCKYLAEMLTRAGREQEAREIEELSRKLKNRLDELAWNGDFYTHHVPEEEDLTRELGVDQSRQVSLSNAYSLNRGLTHEQCKSIISTYQRIREEMPFSSPGEWYGIYPPFKKGFDKHAPEWEYMNGGVLSIVAGELAHGAFEHGFEKYGADILQRLLRLGKESGDYLHCTYKGKLPEAPDRTFRCVGLNEIANTRYPDSDAKSGGKRLSADRTSEAEKKFKNIPFLIPDATAQASTAVELESGKTSRSELNVDQKAASVYFLQSAQPLSLVGTIRLHYNDGSTYTDYINKKKAGNWWNGNAPASKKQKKVCEKAWRSDNKGHYVGLYIYGLDNPHPDKIIRSMEFEKAETEGVWHVAGVTLCDAPVYLDSGKVSYGIPDNWGAAAVVYALMEGLAGIKDTGVAFDKAVLAPRWQAADVEQVAVTAKYEASGGYLSYDYIMNADQNKLDVVFTGSNQQTTAKIFLPEDKPAVQILLDGQKVELNYEIIEESRYAIIEVPDVGVHEIKVDMKS